MRYTLQQQIDATKKSSTGFDYMRILLSMSIMVWHTIIVCYGRDVETLGWTGPYRPLLYFLVPSFFAMSGFLVAGSLFRVNSVPEFVTLRVMRILPALCCEVLISALVIGPALTEASLHDYFTDSLFFSYFLNIVGDVHYFLPGVFLKNALHLVNVQLWTIPFELECYLLITLFALIGLIRKSSWTAVTVLLLTIILFFRDLMDNQLLLDAKPPEYMTVVCFLWGVLLYIYRAKIPYNMYFAGAALVITVVSLSYAKTTYIAALPIAYITVFLGLQNPPKSILSILSDYSYGVYLYGFPIQQALYVLYPKYAVWYIHLPLSFAITLICAYFSWTFLEFKVLSRRKQAIAWVNNWCIRAKERMAGDATRSAVWDT